GLTSPGPARARRFPFCEWDSARRLADEEVVAVGNGRPLGPRRTRLGVVAPPQAEAILHGLVEIVERIDDIDRRAIGWGGADVPAPPARRRRYDRVADSEDRIDEQAEALSIEGEDDHGRAAAFAQPMGGIEWHQRKDLAGRAHHPETARPVDGLHVDLL